MNTLRKFINLLEYHEKDGTVTHQNKIYDINILFDLTENIDTEKFNVLDLIWIFDYDGPDTKLKESKKQI